MNHTSTAADVERVLEWFAAAQVPAQRRTATPRSPIRHADVQAGWLGEPQFSRTEVTACAIFRDMDDAQLDTVAAWAREQRVAPGEEVIRAWDAARDFYVIIDGTATVDRDGELVAELGPGDFFGEMAALDWGAGYGHARSAAVRARSELRLLALSPSHLNQLLATDQTVAERIHRAVRERS